DAAAYVRGRATGISGLVSDHRAVGDIFEDPPDVAVDVAHAERRKGNELALESDDELVEIPQLRVWIDGIRELTGGNVVIGHGAAGRSPGDDTVRNRLRQVGVAVVAAADAVVGRQGARGDAVRHPRVQPAELPVQPGLAVTDAAVRC